jgi:hypothetical protein
MSGIFLLIVLGLWLVLVVGIAYALTKSIKHELLRYAARIAVVACLFPLIVIDELITKPQFEKLCAEGTKLKFDPEKIRGRTIFQQKSDAAHPPLSVGLLNGYQINSQYFDASTKEQIILANSYHLKGGLLIRTLGISQTTAPLMMESYCAPNERPSQKSFLDRYDMKYLEEKDIK